MEFTAKLRYHQGSPQKLRLVVDTIRGKGVQDAVNSLSLSKKHAAQPLSKLLKSAIANAENLDDNVDIDNLFIKEVFVDPGPTLKRLRPRAQGRAFQILKRQSHITIKLDSRPVAAEAATAGDGD